MFILGNFLSACAAILSYLISFYNFAIFAYVIISWFDIDPYNPIVRAIVRITEPVLYLIKSNISTVNLSLGIDISPLIAFLILVFIKEFIVNSLYSFALRLK
ncbi:MAG: YggT family protein [Candidatus Firestonebacteria bacterium]|nr:YggT family protein [Candidatus Firestonebacteria bacterium]